MTVSGTRNLTDYTNAGTGIGIIIIIEIGAGPV